jgi:hypothetical protein
LGFRAPDGTHTNNIENVWSQLKLGIAGEHGVKKSDIDNWLNEFMFKKLLCREDDIN